MFADIAVIAAAVTFMAVWVPGYFRSRVTNGAKRYEQLVGKRLPLSDLKTSGSEASIVLVLAAHCPYCLESAGFYQRLSNTRKQGHYALVAVFGDTEAGKQFLAVHGIEVDQVIAAAPHTIGAPGTPTVFVVDRSGQVHDIWAGRLAPGEEEKVFEAVRKMSTTPPAGGSNPRT